jgi:hypothetical protein
MNRHRIIQHWWLAAVKPVLLTSIMLSQNPAGQWHHD